MTARGLLVAGTTSDAGKSLLVAGLCRVYARRGVRVAPFKSQNMSNNSMVTPGGAEIGRAQWVQAVAARAVPEPAMNPVLLKPSTDRSSHVVLMGQPHGRLGTGQWATDRRELAAGAFASYDDLASRYDLVLCEGAGSPAEVNLRDGDYVNFGLAQAKSLPVVVVGDIDRGGVLAAMYGTWGIVDASDRALIRGWIVNKFRGDVELLRPGLDILAERTGVPTLGVVPWLSDTWLDGEDALTVGAWRRTGARGDTPASLPTVVESDAADRVSGQDTARFAGSGLAGSTTSQPRAGQGAGTPAGCTGSRRTLRVAVVAFSRISNATDADALAAEPGVEVEVTSAPEALAAADLVVLPGSRSTLGDLAWLRERGLDRVLRARAEQGAPVLGICGGYQMLAHRIVDSRAVETPTPQTVNGLGLLPVNIEFSAEKSLSSPKGEWRGHEVSAYEIHHGQAVPLTPSQRDADEAVSRGYHSTGSAAQAAAGGVGRSPDAASLATEPQPFLDGWQAGAVFGTHWHGAFENDGFRREFLSETARRAGVDWQPSSTPGFAAQREQMLNRVADALEEHVDLEALDRIIGLE